MHEFHQCGYFLIKNALDAQELLSMEKEFKLLYEEASVILDEVQKNKTTYIDFYQRHRDKLIVVPELSDKTSICRFEYIMATSEYIQKHILMKIKEIIQQITNHHFILFKDKCNLKNPGGGAFPPHQDIAAYRHFAPQYHITAALNLDDVTIENGCLQVVKNFNQYQIKKTKGVQYMSTKFGVFPFFDFYEGGFNNGDIKENITQQFEWTPIESKKGDILLFHSYLPHQSEKNDSLKPRRIFYFTFNSLEEGDWYEKYYAIKRQDFDNPIFHMSTPTGHSDIGADFWTKKRYF
jgi:ectoine hydroxylase-related dioxygenase (phytanoyl-CoA dioxygenase family)